MSRLLSKVKLRPALSLSARFPCCVCSLQTGPPHPPFLFLHWARVSSLALVSPGPLALMGGHIGSHGSGGRQSPVTISRRRGWSRALGVSQALVARTKQRRRPFPTALEAARWRPGVRRWVWWGQPAPLLCPLAPLM